MSHKNSNGAGSLSANYNFKRLEQEFVEKQLRNGMEWIQKPQNQKKLFDFGVSIVAAVVKGNAKNAYRRH